MEMDINELYEKLAWMIHYPFVITTKALRNHNFSHYKNELQVHGKLIKPNNKPKDLKRNSNGVVNFEYTRNRLLWATREAPSILAIPRDLKVIHKDGKLRGHYKKGIEKEH